MRTEKEKLQREIIDALYDRYNNKEYCTELVCEAMDIWHEQQVNNLDKADVINRRELLLAYHNFYLKWRKSVNDSSPNNCIEDFFASNSL